MERAITWRLSPFRRWAGAQGQREVYRACQGPWLGSPAAAHDEDGNADSPDQHREYHPGEGKSRGGCRVACKSEQSDQGGAQRSAHPGTPAAKRAGV